MTVRGYWGDGADCILVGHGGRVREKVKSDCKNAFPLEAQASSDTGCPGG